MSNTTNLVLPYLAVGRPRSTSPSTKPCRHDAVVQLSVVSASIKAQPGGAMGANGILRLTSIWNYANSANTKNLRYRLGASGVSGTLLMNVNVTTSVGNMVQRLIHNRNAQAPSSPTRSPRARRSASTAAPGRQRPSTLRPPSRSC